MSRHLTRTMRLLLGERRARESHLLDKSWCPEPAERPRLPFSCICHVPPRTFADLATLVAHAEGGG
jgi:hypothetical protein